VNEIMKHAKLTVSCIALLATIFASTLASSRGQMAVTVTIRPSSTSIPQPYTNVTVSDPTLASIDTNASVTLLQSVLHATVQGTGTSVDGTVSVPHAEPPSLLVTRDVVEALVTLDGSVPNAAAIAAWVWSRWHATGGYFDDEYSVNWSTLQDGAGWLASNRYSPMVATGCALDILSMLRQPVSSAVNDSIRTFILSCHDAGTGSL